MRPFLDEKVKEDKLFTKVLEWGLSSTRLLSIAISPFFYRCMYLNSSVFTVSEWLSERADAVCRIQRVCPKLPEVQQRPPANTKKSVCSEAVFATTGQASDRQLCGHFRKPVHLTTACRGLAKR